MHKERHILHSDWTYSQLDRDEWFPATVPGCIHSDLLSGEKIQDPFYRLNEQEQQWVGENSWEYRSSFTVTSTLFARRHLELVFEGLDTYADVYVNEALVLIADNMFRTWRIDVKAHLREGENSLRVVFHSVFDINRPTWENAPFRLQAFANNDQADIQLNLYSRKAGFHYGWDWGPRFITCGIWRPVYLESWDDVRIDHLQIMQESVSAQKAELTAVFEITASKEMQVDLAILNGSTPLAETEAQLRSGENHVRLTFRIENPKLWWTNGLGEQCLYTIQGTIAQQGRLCDQRSSTIGLRTLKVVREQDDIGTSFYVELNGEAVFMKGACYIPQDNFQSRVTPERYEHLIRSAAEANMNMIRVWGGGIYEEDLFYELCDRYGILVWQDMMFACGMYPADDKFLAGVKAEVIDNVKRIRNHPSLAMYCGNNENEIAWETWGWKEQYPHDVQRSYEADLKTLFYELIPNTLAEVDPSRYYLPSSPIAGFGDRPQEDGDTHYWGVWHGDHPFEEYQNNVARFVSEYGFESHPEMNSVMRYTDAQDRDIHSEVMLSHQRCWADNRRDKEHANRIIDRYMQRSFHPPKDFASYLYISQLLQAEGVNAAIEAHRRNMSDRRCMGSLYWQLNDCWPVTSWASIDYYGRWKALHYTVRRAFADMLIVPFEEDELFNIAIVSDRRYPLENATLLLSVQNFSGLDLYHEELPLTVAPNTSLCYWEKPLAELLGGRNAAELVLSAELRHSGLCVSSKLWYFTPVKDLALTPAKITRFIRKNERGYDIELHADRLAKNVCLQVPGDSEGCFSDNYFDLLPGRPLTVTYFSQLSLADIEAGLTVMSVVDSYKRLV